MLSCAFMPVSLRARSLDLDGRELPLVSAAMHYFRVEPRRWGRCLAAVRGLGFRAVESYVPWAVHELRPGKFDFARGRDLGAFVDAAAAEGLAVILRPGPHINAELAHFGLPARIVSDGKLQARTARGTPATLLVPPRGFAAPSYASRAFLDEVRAWYAAVAEVVARRLFPRGPVVALQVDNEHAHFFRSGAYDGDYHPDALARFAGEPPRRFDARTVEDLAPHLAWLSFREAEAVRALAALRAMLDEVGLAGVPRYHNFPPHEPGVYDVAAAETALDFAGIDMYHPRRDLPRVRRRALYLAGSSRLPYVPEMGVGSFPWGPPLGDEDALGQLLLALMNGVAGYNAYMGVERDRWYGAPISVEGEVRPGLSDKLRALHAALDGAGWTALDRAAPIGVIVPRGYQRLALASSHLGPIGPAFGEWLGVEDGAPREDTFGFAGPVQLEQTAWRDAIVDALSRLHLPFVLVDASAPRELLAKRRALVVPTFEFLDGDLAARLRGFADGGGKLLTGPRAPRLDEKMQPLAVELPLGLPASPTAAAALDAALEALAARAGVARDAPAREPDVDTALYRRGSAPALLFVASRADRPRRASVSLDAPATLEDVLDGATFHGAAPEIPLPPGGVRLLRFA